MQAAASMSQRRVITSRCNVMSSYGIEAILVCLQFSHAIGPGSHTYCSIVVYYQAKLSEMEFCDIVTRRQSEVIMSILML